MSLFKRKTKNENGKIKNADNYRCRFRDHNSTVREVTLYHDKSVSATAEQSIKRLVEFRRNKRELDAPLLTFIENLPTTIRDKFVAWNIIDVAQASISEPINKHLAAYHANMQHRQKDKSYTKQTIEHLRKICNEAKFNFITDIVGNKVENYLASLIERGRSIRTRNAYFISLRTFCNWLKKAGIMSGNPLRGISTLNEETDRRRIRRALTDDEIKRLFIATLNGEIHHGLTGYERFLLYRLALETALRWLELRTLTRGAFTFGDDIPSVTVLAKNTKNDRRDVLPISTELANDLANYFANVPALSESPAFIFHLPNGQVGKYEGVGAEMLRRDLEVAGIPYITADGVADFHATRHTSGTRLSRAGVSLQDLQKHFRHSTPMISANRYLEHRITDKANALKKAPLPNIATCVKTSAISDKNVVENMVMNCGENHALKNATQFATSCSQTPSAIGSKNNGVVNAFNADCITYLAQNSGMKGVVFENSPQTVQNFIEIVEGMKSKNAKNSIKIGLSAVNNKMVVRERFELSKSVTTDLQSA